MSISRIKILRKAGELLIYGGSDFGANESFIQPNSLKIDHHLPYMTEDPIVSLRYSPCYIVGERQVLAAIEM